jgi:hypothetical protein
MSRLAEKPYDLAQQIRSAAIAVASEPGWTGPSQAELDAVADEMEAGLDGIRAKALEIQLARTKLEQDAAAGKALLMRVDNLVTALYGRGSSEKIRFGLPPEDLVRNRYPVPDAPDGLRLGDAPGGFSAKWNGTRRATYEVQFFRDPELAQMAGAVVSTKQSAMVGGLSPGTEVYVRVRAILSGRTSGWSETVRRFVNG